jgi:hypothetical protein
MSLINPAMGYEVGNVRIVRAIVALEARDKRKAGIRAEENQTKAESWLRD